MKAKKELIYKHFKQMYGLKAKNVKQGHGSFITMEFGKELEFEITIRGKVERETRGEWYFWIQMCSWRIDENFNPIAGCEDSRETIEKALKKIENKKLANIEILNNAFDMKVEFENSIIINLFSIYTEEEDDGENWMLFTPERKVLAVGPGQQIDYRSSGE